MTTETKTEVAVYHCTAPEFRINVGCRECRQQNCQVRDNQGRIK